MKDLVDSLITMDRRRYGFEIVRKTKILVVVLLILQGIDAYPNLKEHPTETKIHEHRKRQTSQDDIARLVEEAFQNGELLDAVHWSQEHGFPSSRTVQRDTSRYQDTYTSFVSSKPTTTSQLHQTQRRVAQYRGIPTRSKEMQADGQIVFPEDKIHQPQQSVMPGPAPVCENSFCEHSPYYPKELVDAALRRNESLKLLASVDVDLGERIGSMDEMPLCQSNVEVVYPVSAESKNKGWLFVVNQDNFKQGVRVETCRNNSSPCSIVLDATPFGYKMTCKQHFISRELVAVTNDGEVAPELFEIPASCCCHAKFVPDLRMRFGGSHEQPSPTSTKTEEHNSTVKV